MAPWLPEVPEGQWSEAGVVAAAVDWLASPGLAGAEVDLAKAFDTTPHEIASEALRFGGTPDEVEAWVLATWRAPRSCHVAGDLAEPLMPIAGIPAGDPLCPRVLGLVLEPWDRTVKRRCPSVKTWAYLDDRSLKTMPTSKECIDGESLQDAAVRLTDEALELTADFDAKVGLSENKKKRQRWAGGEACEHLGISAQPSSAAEIKPAPAKLRNSWQDLEEIARRVALMPGSVETRTAVATTCVLPKMRWAAPLTEAPPWRLDVSLMRALLRTRNMHWCAARFWAERVQSSPSYACALLTLKAAGSHCEQQPRLMMEAVRQHAAKLSLAVVSISDQGVLVEPAAGADQRIRRFATAAAREQELATQVRRAHPCAFYAEGGHGQHVCRTIAKVCCLARMSASRHDVEGAHDVDVEVLSDQAWKKWKASLREEELKALTHWRAGAVAAPSRQQGNPTRSTACPHCKKAMASARHLWAECEFFSSSRKRLEEAYGIGPQWWSRQPRITAKSGWITHAAALSPAGRVKALIAANAMGIQVVQSCWAVHEELGQGSQRRAHCSTIWPP